MNDERVCINPRIHGTGGGRGVGATRAGRCTQVLMNTLDPAPPWCGVRPLRLWGWTSGQPAPLLRQVLTSPPLTHLPILPTFLSVPPTDSHPPRPTAAVAAAEAAAASAAVAAAAATAAAVAGAEAAEAAAKAAAKAAAEAAVEAAEEVVAPAEAEAEAEAV